MLDALLKAIELCGTQAEFARRLDAIGQTQDPALRCTPGHVWAWVNRDKKISELWARHAETALEGAVTRHDFRPDVFGVAEKAAA
jgi:DNA-binding transcriptional regulator YdaS (Cro superfamily)